MIRKRLFLLLLLVVLVSALVTGVGLARRASSPAAQPSPIHPTFALLDKDGVNVLDSGAPVSAQQTCGQCHDTEYIASHAFHADLGLSDLGNPAEGARPWDLSNGPFGEWSPLTYRRLSTVEEERPDLGTAGWIMANAERFVGGGPGVVRPEGVLHPEDWDWAKSGDLEIDCFLCHLPDPNNEARIQAIRRGDFRWASTATLLGTGIVKAGGDSLAWNADAFTAEGELATPTIQDPTNENCAQCHGLVHTSEEPLSLAGCSLENWQTATSGQVISGDKISASGMNLVDKEALARSWDVHAERGLECTDCHYALNNPAYYQSDESPAHLEFDPRRLEIGEYLQRPDHNLARGQSAQTNLAPELKGSMRRCEGCHETETTHAWLPFAARHLEELACESCHAPALYAPTLKSVDWTVITQAGEPATACRGVDGQTDSISDLVTGFTPVLLSRQNIDGQSLLAPYNLITSWYWVYDDAGGPRPVRLQDLQATYLSGGAYAEEIVAALDSNADGELSEAELLLDTPEKQAVVAERLSALGLANPRIEGEIQPYSINHNIVAGEGAIRECSTCHSDDSRITQAMVVSDRTPGGVTPTFVSDVNTRTSGSLSSSAGVLAYVPAAGDQNLYIFGHSRVSWVDWLGALFFMGVLAAVAVHAGFRFYSAVRSPRSKPELERVYMYGVYERFWHWLQTCAILVLLFTGLIIHRPDMFGFFSYQGVVTVHNVVAILLVINAGLSLFYHLASGEIRQYLPRPYGFFDDAIVQAKYYLGDVFKGSEHPFAKRPDRKLNPLQQVTYFAILNVLLPLQILTGAMMMGVQQFPRAAAWAGGLPFLAPLHSLVAWTFAAFIVGHVYLTTTGPRPLTSLEGMTLGWEDVEKPHTQTSAGTGSVPAKEAR
ncbi:MAG: cytochrome b/b6 domain-containing protein [Anaerolineales bacterium]|nr:cytochrome b/b6 domain-containing protein [Anaerolineales bacterium]